MGSVTERTIAKKSTPPRRLEVASLLAVSACFVTYGGLSLVYATRWPATVSLTDFYYRWQEISYVFRGVDPRDVLSGSALADPAVGQPQFTYPPWSYILGSLFIPPIGAGQALSWFAFVNVCSIGVIVQQASKLGAPFGARARVLLALSAVTTIAVPVTLRHLNYSIVLCAALALYARCDEKKWHGLAGLALAALSLKPQIGALFFLIPLFRRAWATLLIAVAVNLAATATAAVLLSKSPLELVAEMATEGATYTDAYLGVFDLLRRFNLASTPTVLLLGLVFGVVTTILVLNSHRHLSTRTLVGVVACITTLWTYQRTMDLLILGFLVGPLAVRALRTRTTQDWVVFLVVGCSYWFPYLARMAAMPVVPEIFRAVWLFGAIWLLQPEQDFGDNARNLDAPDAVRD